MSLLSLLGDVVGEVNGYVNLLDAAWVESGFAELDDLAVDVDELTGLGLDLFELLLLGLLGLGLWLLLGLGAVDVL